MIRVALPALACAMIAMPALAQLPANPPDPLPRYLRNGGGFSCEMSAADFKKYDNRKDIPGDAPCLRIGPLELGMQRTAIEKTLGAPRRSLSSDGIDYFMYGLKKDDAGAVVTYVVLSYGKNGRAHVIQLTGAKWPGAWRLAGLTLGDSEQAVIAPLGKALFTRPSDDPGATEWNYDPWHFSLEVKNGQVSSIRVEDK